jgi:hypothetical protein
MLFAIAGLALVVSCTDAAPPLSVTAEAPQQASATPPPANEHHDEGQDAPRITLADAKKDFDDGKAVFVDVRKEEAYKEEHIRGAINLAKGILDEQLNKISKGKKIIAYCS